MRGVLDKLPAGAYTCDADGLITYYNEHAVGLWGRAPAIRDPIDRFCGSFRLHSVDGAPLAHDRCWMALALQHDVPYDGCEIVVERPDGQRKNVLAYATPLHDGSGRLLGAVNVLVDVSELKETQDALIRSEERLQGLNQMLEYIVDQRTDELQCTNSALEERNRDLEQFAYVASHDLREPLRTVISFVQLLERHCGDHLDETARRYSAEVTKGAFRLHRLVEDLLTYCRLGGPDASFEPVDTRVLVEELLADLQEGIASTGAVVTLGDLPVIMGDRPQIRQLFQNLLVNAVRFGKPDFPPRIEVRAEKLADLSEEEWRFSVADDGIGIDMELADHLFEMFQRLHAKGVYQGMGIGLAICKRIVERHGGRIWAESEPGRGSTFFFSLPVHPRNGGNGTG